MLKLRSFIVVLLATWLCKSTSLPQFYHRLQDRRDVTVRSLRKLEKSGMRVAKLLLDVKYFESCIELGVCPAFLKFKPPNLPAYGNIKSVLRQVLNNQIKSVMQELKSARSKYKSDLKQVTSKVSYVEKISLCHLLKKRFELHCAKVKETHKKKLLKVWKDNRIRSPDCLMNLSDLKLSALEENVLRLGLKNHILPLKLDEGALRVEIEKLVSKCLYDTNVILNLEFTEKLKSLVKSYIADSNGICSNKQNQMFHKTLRSLKCNKKIKVCRYDKGNGVVVLNNSEYFNKLDSIVLDKEKFKEVFVPKEDDHPIIKNERKIVSFLNRNIKSKIGKDVLEDILPSGSQPGKIYGLCKVHKANYPMRPVISMLGSAEYKLAKYLDTFIKPNINEDFSVNSTKSFIERLSEFKFSDNDQVVSLDVCSLFTNVPLDETIKLIADRVYSQFSACVPPFEKKWFIKLLKFATSGIFMYKNKFYQQVDGVAMGSPLGPSLANFFLGHLERHNFFTNKNLNPKFYIRYVDDIFAVFDNSVSCEDFLNHINNQHKNIKFTIEKSIDNVLPFLDTRVEIVGDSFESCVFRKPTNTNVLLNASAICPTRWKKGLILGAIHRAKMICSSSNLFEREVDNLRDIFHKNGYSISFFNELLEYFVNNEDNKDKCNDNNDRRYIVKIPYVGNVSYVFKSKLIDLFFKDLGLTISPIFMTTKVSDFFSLKSRTPKELNSRVAYKFTCVCNTSLTYIGKTKRHLVVRSKEHLDCESETKSEIKEHLKQCLQCKNVCNLDNFEILKKCQTDQEAKINEAILIKNELPFLNKNLFNSGSLYTLKIYK